MKRLLVIVFFSSTWVTNANTINSFAKSYSIESLCSANFINEIHQNFDISNFQANLQNIVFKLKQNPELTVQLQKLALKSKQNSDYQDMLERLTLKINQTILHKSSSLAPEEYKLWLQYPRPEDRSKASLSSSESCIDKKGPDFIAFAKELKSNLTRRYFRKQFAQPLIEILPEIDFFPAGGKSFFGAIATNNDRGLVQICINPEESPLLLTPKLMHELKHATNKQNQRLKISLVSLINELNTLYKEIEEKELAIESHDNNLKKPEENGFDAIIDLLDDAAISEKEFTNLINIKFFPVKTKNANFLRKTWGEIYSLNKRKKNQEKLLASKKAELDQERFIDEHRAYAISYLSAYHLIKDRPDFFCNIRVPSFQAKLPIFFFEYYLHLEQKIKQKTISEWIAKIYIDNGQYLKTSIYRNSPKESKIMTGLKKRALLEIEKELSMDINQ